MSRVLHIFDSNSAAGCAHCSLPEGTEITICPYDFQVNRLPHKLCPEEWIECKKNTYSSLYDKECEKFFSIDFAAYDTVLVWHSKDANSLLLLWFIAFVFDKTVNHIDVSLKYKKCRVGELSPLQFKECLNLVRTLTKRQKNIYQAKYTKFCMSNNRNTVRVIRRKNIQLIPINYFVSKLQKNITTQPRSIERISCETFGNLYFNDLISPLFLEFVLLNILISRLEYKTEIEWKRSEYHQHKIFSYYNTPLLIGKKDLRNAYSIKIYRQPHLN